MSVADAQELSTDVPVVVIGAGFAGIAVSHELRLAGIEHIVLERADRVGGTWRDNIYPGCACDIPSHLYSLSWAPNPNWSRHFAPAAEIDEYLSRVAARERLAERLITGVEVRSAHWSAAESRWRLVTSRGETSCQLLVVAAGGLSEPKTPDIPGMADFPGPVVHTAQWDPSVSLTGLRVGVVGTGASAIQLVPAIVDDVSSLTVFQRTPAWVLPRRDRAVPGWQRRLYTRWPMSQRMVREVQYWRRELVVHAMVSRLTLLERAADQAKRRLAAQVPDEQLRARLTPDYLPGCKRALLSDDFYPALSRDRVEVVAALAGFDGHEALTVDGEGRPLDAVVFATGFEVLPPPLADRVFGVGGVSVAKDWADRGGAFLGMATAAAPNLFWLTGPNTGLGGNSMIVMIEAQAHYIRQAAAAVLAEGPARAQVLAVSPAVQRAYTDWIDRRMVDTVWQRGGCQSWYLDDTGRVAALWPEQTWRYRRMTRDFRSVHYQQEA
jgi:cation diffusion facilitator CzcD-associated flavoprotein CzcO